MRRWLGLFLITFLFSPALAAPMEARVQLHDGKLATSDLSRVLLESFHLKGVELDVGTIDLSDLNRTRFVSALNKSLGEGCNVKVEPQALVIHVDPAKLPSDTSTLRKAVRVFTAVASPDATAAQRRYYGLLMPKNVDPQRPMVVLVHGLDCNRSNWFPMADLLVGEGYQVAYFTYPSDGPVEESVALLTTQMQALHETFPDTPLSIVAHSLGGLVARGYVEGNDYLGGVKHLILLATPNSGSRWATYRWALEVEEHYNLWRHEKDWSPTWMITDGLGEAGRDLKPTSAFLAKLNDHPRREGVAYTVIAGNQHPAYPMAADAIEGVEHLIPHRAENWWGFRQTGAALQKAADKMRHKTGKSDGPVSTKSTKLANVEDFVVLPASHSSLYYPVDGNKPVAWDVIRDRLAK